MAKNEQMWQRKSTHIRFEDNDMDFYFLVPLAFGAERGSAIGECFYIASHIEEGDPDSWAEAWTSYGDRLQETAAESEQRGARVSAGEAYLRAYTYYRTGAMMERPTQPEARATFDKMRHSFRTAVHLLDLPVEIVEVPYRNTTLPGYFMQGRGQGPRPTLITAHGGEMFASELYFWVGAAGMRRGYNVLSVDHPGGPVVRFTRPDLAVLPFYEDGLPALSDYALGGSESDGVAVIGFSGGGYHAMRLAAQDDRIDAVVASAPIYDLHKLATAEFPKALQKAPAFVGDVLMKVAASVSPSTKVALERTLWSTGAGKLSELIDAFKEIGPVDPTSITCPMLCLTGEGESEMQNEQARYVYERLPNPEKAFHLFTREEGADAHCQNNNLLRLQQVAFDWLDQVFAA